MNEQSNTSEKMHHMESSKITNDDVAAYLRKNPAFLIENRELLFDIQVVLSQQGVVSLTQIQSEQYRDKIEVLKSQLDSLVSHARKNEEIYKAYAELNIDIAQTSTVEALNQTLEARLVHDLGLEKVQLILLNHKDTTSNIELSEIQQHSIFDKKLSKTNFYLGRLGKLERQAIFPDAQAESVAMIKLGEQKPFGVLAIASKDPLHFTPEMDTMLIEFLRKNLNFHILKLV